MPSAPDSTDKSGQSAGQSPSVLSRDYATMKTKQAIAKRFIKTTHGKLLKRYVGQDHFNARERGVTTRGKRRDVTCAKVDVKTISQYL